MKKREELVKAVDAAWDAWDDKVAWFAAWDARAVRAARDAARAVRAAARVAAAARAAAADAAWDSSSDAWGAARQALKAYDKENT